jgi:hypothetical protein
MESVIVPKPYQTNPTMNFDFFFFSITFSEQGMKNCFGRMALRVHLD